MKEVIAKAYKISIEELERRDELKKSLCPECQRDDRLTCCAFGGYRCFEESGEMMLENNRTKIVSLIRVHIPQKIREAAKNE